MKKIISFIFIMAMICCTSISFADTDTGESTTPIINNQVEVDMVPMDNDQIDNQIEKALNNVSDPVKKEKIIEYISIPVYVTYDEDMGVKKNSKDVVKQIIELDKLAPKELDEKITRDFTKIVNDSKSNSDVYISEEGLDLIKEYAPAQLDKIDANKIVNSLDMIAAPQRSINIATYKKSSPYKSYNSISGATMMKVRITVTWKAYTTGTKKITSVNSIVNGTYNPRFWNKGSAKCKTVKMGTRAHHNVTASFMHKQTGLITYYKQGAKLYNNGKCTF